MIHIKEKVSSFDLFLVGGQVFISDISGIFELATLIYFEFTVFYVGDFINKGTLSFFLSASGPSTEPLGSYPEHLALSSFLEDHPHMTTHKYMEIFCVCESWRGLSVPIGEERPEKEDCVN